MNHSENTPPDTSDRSDLKRRLRTGGGFRRLRSFQVASVIYDATFAFCDRFLDKRSRTVDQMIQAARSGRQNIAEGSRASTTSSQSELKLVNVARGSLEELLLDYEDFLRQHNQRQWDKNDPEARRVRALARQRSDQSDPPDPIQLTQPYKPWLSHDNPAVVANTLICLIHQANYLLDQQITALEREFVQEGGYRETLAAARREYRERHPQQSDQSDRSNRSDQNPPCCPRCGKPMRHRTARQGRHAGALFWGCSAYPACKRTRPVDS